ncbi:MAG: protease inhibitor I42 family protein [Gammaproteobacteria bacterium]|nr:protease inhibitor I42 family protein [Gammaproteobacteria bacterium]
MIKSSHYLTLAALSLSAAFANPLYPIDPNHPEVIHPESNTFFIELPSNSTTGYQWKVISTTQGVSVKQKVYLPPEQPCCGAPGVEQLDVFLAVNFPGQGEIVMAYIRPWEQSGDAEVKTVDIKIEK